VTEKMPRLVVPELTKALNHPTRSHILAILTERIASPKEMAKELDRTIRHVTYHLSVLEDLDCIELVKSEPSSGGRVMEHFFRATKRPWLDRQSWERLDEKDQRSVTSTLMELVTDDIADSMAAGTFNDPPDNHISRTPMTVDDPGWDEVTAELNSTLSNLMDIQARVNARSTPSTETMPIKVEIIHFRSPSAKSK
jgi:DNA-binding transcriptional ArsR family regulator